MLIHLPGTRRLILAKCPAVAEFRPCNYYRRGSDGCRAALCADTPLCSFGRPSRTSIVWPSTVLPCNAAIACPASTAVISTKANPRDRPVSLSVISLSLRTVPSGSKRERIAAGEVPEFKLPTKMFFV